MKVFSWIFAVVMCCAVSNGCNTSGPALHSVTGQVFLDGAPAEGATVILEGGEGPNKPSGTVTADGSFTIETFGRGKGAVAGEYTILISWYPPDARTNERSKNKLPAIYADAGKTPLPKITVKPGQNAQEPFRLTSK